MDNYKKKLVKLTYVVTKYSFLHYFPQWWNMSVLHLQILLLVSFYLANNQDSNFISGRSIVTSPMSILRFLTSWISYNGR